MRCNFCSPNVNPVLFASHLQQWKRNKHVWRDVSLPYCVWGPQPFDTGSWTARRLRTSCPFGSVRRVALRKHKNTKRERQEMATERTSVSWSLWCWIVFLGAFPNYEKRLLASSCLSVRLSVRMEQRGLHWKDLDGIWYLSFFFEIMSRKFAFIKNWQ